MNRGLRRLLLFVVAGAAGGTGISTFTQGERASGLMQLMPAAASALARALGLDDISLPEHNIHAGVFHLRRLYDLFNGAEKADRVRLTLAAYNSN
jgi:soluble lytic murein transglycosylase-like protein